MFEFLRPLEIAVAWIMVTFHTGLTAVGMPETSGWTWALSIVGLVIVIRILLIPLFVKQIKASRGMQLIQPEMRKIQQKYKGKTDPASRKAMQEETMGLYRKSGTNPFASCLPILLQSPIFFALFRVLNGLAKIASGEDRPIGPMTREVAAQAESSTLFGAQLSSTFLGSDDLSVKVLTVVLIILMSAIDLHHAAAADDEEHAGGGAGQPVRPAAEDPAVRAAGDLCGVRGELPDRRPHLLVDHNLWSMAPAVLRHPTDAGAGVAGREGAAGAADQAGQGSAGAGSGSGRRLHQRCAPRG